MATYTEILPNGDRRVVKYKVHHDGPVSERLYLLKRVKYFGHQVDLRPGDRILVRKLRKARRALARFDSAQKKVSSRESHKIQNLARRHEQGHSSQDQAQRDKGHKRPAWHRNRSASDSAIGLGLPANTPGQPSIPPLDALFGTQYPLEPINIGPATEANALS